MADIATDSGHWYAKDGAPAYEVPNKSKGGMRPTRITDAKKLGLFPSVTTILNVKPKPALERWKQNQILHASLTLPMEEGETLDNYAKRCMTDAFEQSRKARDIGSAVHGSIELSYQGKPYDQSHKPLVDAVRSALSDFHGEWLPERSFSSKLGYGGKVDLHHKTGNGVVVDYKVTDKSLDNKLHWDEHIIQLSAYREGLGIPNAQCVNVFVSTTDQDAKVHVWNEDEAKWGFDMFKALFQVWKLDKRFDPSSYIAL